MFISNFNTDVYFGLRCSILSSNTSQSRTRVPQKHYNLHDKVEFLVRYVQQLSVYYHDSHVSIKQHVYE